MVLNGSDGSWIVSSSYTVLTVFTHSPNHNPPPLGYLSKFDLVSSSYFTCRLLSLVPISSLGIAQKDSALLEHPRRPSDETNCLLTTTACRMPTPRSVLPPALQ